MKKTSLILAAFFAVSAISLAKETIVAPAVVKEPAVAPILKSVVETPAWRPNGDVDLSYKYYGKDEYSSADFGRVQMSGKYEFTPIDRVEFRFRRYNSYQTTNHQSLLEDEQKIGSFGDSSSARLRYFYENGKLWNTKVGLTQRLQYENLQNLGQIEQLFDDTGNPIMASLGEKSQSFEYRVMLDYTDYMSWTPEWFKSTGLTLEPYYKYTWSDSVAEKSNLLGLDLKTTFELPQGFSFEFNIYPGWVDSTPGISLWELAYEAYLYYGYNLLESGKYSLDFNFEGGIDPYIFHSDKDFGKNFKTSSDAWYNAYMLPGLELTYKRNESMKLYLGAAGEYRNWRYGDKPDARKWSWMPQAYAGMYFSF